MAIPTAWSTWVPTGELSETMLYRAGTVVTRHLAAADETSSPWPVRVMMSPTLIPNVMADAIER